MGDDDIAQIQILGPDDGTVCSELDLDDGIAQHAGNLPLADAQTVDFWGVIQKIFGWFGMFRVRRKSQREKQLARQIVGRLSFFIHMDVQAAEIRRKLELTQAKLEAVYGDSSIQSPSTHPKVKKLHRTLTKLKRAAAALNARRYKMRRSIS